MDFAESEVEIRCEGYQPRVTVDRLARLIHRPRLTFSFRFQAVEQFGTWRFSEAV